ncbi:hypothetical protein ARSEF1564_007483 [Beauveria bassiana]
MTIPSISNNSAGAATLADEQLPEAGETAPLLGHDTPPPLQQKSSRPSPFTRPVSVVTILVYVVYFVALELSQSLPGNAFHQVVEENLCRDMHGRADAEFCGADNDVQSALAVLFAWHGTVQLLPGLLTAIPYALLADRYGQKPFIIINAFGVALAAAGDRFICYWPQTFSVYSLWAAPLLSFVGGGLQVCNALLFANVTGLTTDASRPSVISVLVTLAYGPRLIATMASSKMIQLYGPWLLLWLSLGSAVVAFFSAFFLLEPTQRPRSSADAIASGSTAGPLADDDPYFSKGGLKARILKSYQETIAGFSYLLKQYYAKKVWMDMGKLISAFTSTIMIFGVVIWTLGSMYNLILRNLLVLAVGENSVVLFSCVNTVETIGNLVIAPIIAQLFKFGLHFGGVWVTMPVMIGSGFSVLALLILGSQR